MKYRDRQGREYEQTTSQDSFLAAAYGSAMGRALMSRPKIVVMDEPSMGLSPILVSTIFKIIEDIRKSGTTVLLVEQNAKKALSIADRAYVLETGSITLEGKADDLLHDESVQKAYLGE